MVAKLFRDGGRHLIGVLAAPGVAHVRAHALRLPRLAPRRDAFIFLQGSPGEPDADIDLVEPIAAVPRQAERFVQ